jgi:hypothetical protein
MKTAADFIPAQLDAFREQIKPYKGTQDTPEARESAANIISNHAGMLQLLDLSLSNQQARAMLAQVYRQL